MRQTTKGIYPALASVLLLISACDTGSPLLLPVTFTGFTMGTTYTVKINEPGFKTNVQEIKTGTEKILEKVNQQMSTYLEDSELSRINQAQTTGWQPISDDLFTVINEAIRISNISSGAFDITIGPVVNLWGFGPDARPEEVPDNGQISSVLDKVGYQYLHLRKSPPGLKKDREDIYIDLSGIAKGFAVDKLAAYLDGLVLQNYLVEVGGEIRAKGRNPEGIPWQIGIEKPVTSQRSIQRIINLANTAMATSGDYRNYFEHDGIRYSHTIDPKTGKPIKHRLASVTVLHPSAMAADAMATALLVMGPEPGIELAMKENIAALFIIKDKDTFTEKMTDPFKQYIHH